MASGAGFQLQKLSSESGILALPPSIKSLRIEPTGSLNECSRFGWVEGVRMSLGPRTLLREPCGACTDAWILYYERLLLRVPREPNTP